MPKIDPLEARAALRDVLPVILAIMPFGAVYGTVAIDSGLTMAQTLGLSGIVYAGASQLVALQMIGLSAPVWSIVLVVFALNFRHVLYSASVGRHLGRFTATQKAAAFFLLADPTFGAAEARANGGALTRSYYFVYGLLLYVFWLVATLAGALFGSALGDTRVLALDFILPAYFLTFLMSFRTRPHFWPVVASSLATSGLVYVTAGSPWHVTIGACGGILYAALRAPEAAPEKRIAGEGERV